MLSIIFLSGCTNQTDDRPLVTISADWVSYATFDEMANDATDIVRAEILSSTVKIWRIGYGDLPHIVYTIRILEVFQGDLQVGDEIEMEQLGGESDYMVIINPNKIPIEIGDDLILFLLNRDPSTPAGILHQGVYRLSKEIDSIEEIDASIELISVVDDEGWIEIEITVEDLWDLEEN